MFWYNNKIIQKDLEEIYQSAVDWERFDGQTFFVTGAYGMLPSYFVFFLIYLNEEYHYNIRIIAAVRNVEKCRNQFGEFCEKQYFSFYIDSISEKISIDESINYIVHAAGIADPRLYGCKPIEVLTPNILGTYRLLELAEEKKSEGFLLFSSGDIYGYVENSTRITESVTGKINPLDIHSCYGESKRMAETMCLAWNVEKGIPTKILRIWHTYGPTMNIEQDPRVFASFVKNVHECCNIEVKSSGLAKRTFCYITDAIISYFKVLLDGNSGEAYNICNSSEFWSVNELAEIMVELFPERKLKVVHKQRNDSYLENRAISNILPDNEKALALGCKFEISAQEGFRRTLLSIEEG